MKIDFYGNPPTAVEFDYAYARESAFRVMLLLFSVMVTTLIVKGRVDDDANWFFKLAVYAAVLLFVHIASLHVFGFYRRRHDLFTVDWWESTQVVKASDKHSMVKEYLQKVLVQGRKLRKGEARELLKKAGVPRGWQPTEWSVFDGRGLRYCTHSPFNADTARSKGWDVQPVITKPKL